MNVEGTREGVSGVGEEGLEVEEVDGSATFLTMARIMEGRRRRCRMGE